MSLKNPIPRTEISWNIKALGQLSDVEPMEGQMDIDDKCKPANNRYILDD